MKHFRSFSVIFTLFGVFSFLPPLSTVWAGADFFIEGHEKAVVAEDKIYLGQICTVTGKNGEGVRSLEKILLGKAPQPGNVRRIDVDYIRLRLKQADLDLSKITLRVPHNIEVARATVTVSRKEIKKAVYDYIRANIPWDKDRVRINSVQVDSDVVLPKGNVSYRIEPLRNTDFRGKVPLPIHFSVNGLFQKRILAMADISVLAEVVVLRKSVSRYHRITDHDIELREKDLSGTRSNVITDPEEVLGQRAKRSIAAGTILRPDLIEYPPLVKRGDVVLMVAESAGLRITALGVVDQREGRRGEKIKVENMDSKKSIYARVVDAKTVEIDF